MVSACSTPALFDLLAGFHRMYPAVDISLSEADSGRLVPGLRDGRFDLALIGVALLPASLAAEHDAELHAVTITGPALRARIELAWRPAGRAAQALILLAQAGQPAERG